MTTAEKRRQRTWDETKGFWRPFVWLLIAEEVPGASRKHRMFSGLMRLLLAPVFLIALVAFFAGVLYLLATFGRLADAIWGVVIIVGALLAGLGWIVSRILPSGD